MELTVLGCSATYPGPGRAASSYLIRSGNTKLLLDCGTGALANLQHFIEPASLDAVVISHFHPDHFLDLYPLRYMLEWEVPRPQPLPVYSPQGGLEKISSLQPDSRETFARLFDFRAAGPNGEVMMGDLKLRFLRTNHVVETNAVRIEGDRILAYSSDSGPCDELVEIARGSDLFLCEATWQELPADRAVGHLLAEEAGTIAARAEAKHLMITHVWPTLDPRRSSSLAEKTFGPGVLLAAEGETVLF